LLNRFQDWLIFVATKSKLLVIVFALFVGVSIPLVNYSKALILSLMVSLFMVLAFPLLLAFFRGKINLLEPVYIFVAIYGYMYFLKPFLTIIIGEDFFYDEYIVANAIGVSIIGMMSLYLGYYLRFGGNIARRLPIINGPWNFRKLKGVAWFFLLLGVSAYCIFINRSGGFYEFFSLPHGYGGKYSESTAYIYQSLDFIFPAIFILSGIALQKKGSLLSNRVLVFLIMFFLFFFIFQGGRAQIFFLVTGLFSLYWVLGKIKRARIIKLGFLTISILLILGLVPFYRGYFYLGSEWGLIKETSLEENIKKAFTASEREEEFNTYTAIVFAYPSRVDYVYGKRYLQSFLHPVPRLIWRTKPLMWGEEWINFLMESKLPYGVVGGILGEFYEQLGTVAVCIGMFLTGLFLKLGYEYFRNNKYNPCACVFFALFFSFIIQVVAQGAITWMLRFPGFLIPTIVSYWYAKVR